MAALKAERAAPVTCASVHQVDAIPAIDTAKVCSEEGGRPALQIDRTFAAQTKKSRKG
jgi:hypothetical protein